VPLLLSFHILIYKIGAFDVKFHRSFSPFRWLLYLSGFYTHVAVDPNRLLASIGSDDILFQFNSMSREESSSSLSNPNREEVTVFAIHPTHPNSFAIGTKAGVIKYLRPVHQMHL
jgi:hypothetical protein